MTKADTFVKQRNKGVETLCFNMVIKFHYETMNWPVIIPDLKGKASATATRAAEESSVKKIHHRLFFLIIILTGYQLYTDT